LAITGFISILVLAAILRRFLVAPVEPRAHWQAQAGKRQAPSCATSSDESHRASQP
jgi:hypothetical protein